ncbi:PREDICTED: non-functional NADPH-dependent, partial [Prunus dulcis]
MNPFWQQKKFRDFCKVNGVIVTAFSPLGGIGSFWGCNHVLEKAKFFETLLRLGEGLLLRFVLDGCI